MKRLYINIPLLFFVTLLLTCSLIVTGQTEKSDCEAWFTYTTTPNSTHFVAYSVPENADLYLWDFGDGSTGEGQQADHQYFPVNGNSFLVVLTTITYDSLTQDSCTATFQEEVWPFDPTGDCINFIHSETNDFQTYYFAGTAEPEAFEYIWDFGDGETATGDSVMHKYNPANGFNYIVSLATYSLLYPADTCIAVSYDFIWINPCSNFISYETEDSLTYTFHGEAGLPVLEYFWDFDDGSTGSGQTVVHTFDPSVSDTFNVVLQTISYDSIAGDTCSAVSNELIIVKQTQYCLAAFTYKEEFPDPLTISFTDQSAGNISSWQWDMGDSTFSNEQNPVHIYAAPGIYYVCLTVINDSTGCSDTYCDSVPVEGYPLTALFSYELDTFSLSPNKYLFTDLSLGYPGNWNWDFGDGTTSQIANPVHTYADSGTFQVCLQVSKNTSSGTVTSEYCQTITTPNYYDFGGTVYLGEFPMNNSGVISDTAMAFLYKTSSLNGTPFDSMKFSQYGYYWFHEILEGSYLVKIRLTKNSLNYESFIPSYYHNSRMWFEATPLNITENSYDYDIVLPEVSKNQNGTGVISGEVMIDENCYDGSLPEGITVILLRGDNTVAAFSETGSSGNWEMTGIPAGNYHLEADFAGFYPEPVNISIDDNNNVITDIVINLSCQGTGYIETLYEKFNIKIFPNPVQDNLHIELSSLRQQEISVKIYSITGEMVSRKYFQLQSGENNLTINTGNLPHGNYLLSVESVSTNGRVFKKFVK